MQPLVGVTSDLMRDVLVSVFEADGASRVDAALLARFLVDSDLAGHPSHGVYRVAEYHRACRSGAIDPKGQTTVTEQRPGAMAIVDGGGTFGQVAAQFAAEIACERATVHGLSAVALRNCSHVGRLSDHVAAVADRGMIGIMTANDAGANLMVAPPGGKQGRLGTNPFAYAVPRAHNPHLILDMSTSTVAYGSLVVDRRRQGLAGEERELTASNEPVLETFGGLKGFGLSLLVDVLSGVLTGAGWSSSRNAAESQGVFLLAIDPDRFCGRSNQVQAVEEMIDWIKSCETSSGEALLVPGEASERARHLNGGVVKIDPTTWDDLLEVFADAGVPPPPVR